MLQNPADGTMYGLQKGKSPNYETVQPQLGNGQDITFDFVVHAKQTSGSAFSLTGPFVQGTPGNRFVYINLGSYAGQPEAPWSGRMKVPLAEADFQNALSEGGAYGWSCTVSGRTVDGKPVFATVKPFGGWTMRKLSD